MIRSLAVALGSLMLALVTTMSSAEPVRTLADGRTGLVEFESLTFPLSSGQEFRRVRPLHQM